MIRRHVLFTFFTTSGVFILSAVLSTHFLLHQYFTTSLPPFVLPVVHSFSFLVFPPCSFSPLPSSCSVTDEFLHLLCSDYLTLLSSSAPLAAELLSADEPEPFCCAVKPNSFLFSPSSSLLFGLAGLRSDALGVLRRAFAKHLSGKRNLFSVLG